MTEPYADLQKTVRHWAEHAHAFDAEMRMRNVRVIVANELAMLIVTPAMQTEVDEVNRLSRALAAGLSERWLSDREKEAVADTRRALAEAGDRLVRALADARPNARGEALGF